MSDRAFRFGVVSASATSGEAWLAAARRVEELGYSTLLAPDTQNTLSPFAAIGAASAVTTRLRFGTFVLSAPNRTPGMVAWETASVAQLTDDRFELGIGGGRPDAEGEAAALGQPFGTAGERIAQVGAAIDAVRERAPKTRILVAAGGPKALELAAEKADTIALGVPPRTSIDEVAERVDRLRQYAGARFDDLEIAINMLGVGELPDWAAKRFGLDAEFLAKNETTAMLTGTVEEMVDALQRRRERLGLSYVAVGYENAERLAPVVERLTGR